MDPLWIKYAHILGATVLFGTGLGTAFHMWMTHRSGDVRAIAVASRNTVLADWLFTTPAVIMQPLTGALLIWHYGYALTDWWILASIGLYVLTGLCWLPVVGLQIRAARLSAKAAATGAALPPDYHRTMRIWFLLGWPAFIAVLVIFHLMLFKPMG